MRMNVARAVVALALSVVVVGCKSPQRAEKVAAKPEGTEKPRSAKPARESAAPKAAAKPGKSGRSEKS